MGLQQQGLRNGSRYHQVISFKKVDSKGRPRQKRGLSFLYVMGAGGAILNCLRFFADFYVKNVEKRLLVT